MGFCLTKPVGLGLLWVSSVLGGCGSTSDGGAHAAAGATVGAATAGAGTTPGGGGGAAATGGADGASGGRAAGGSGAGGDRSSATSLGTVQVVRVMPEAPQASARFGIAGQAASTAPSTNPCESRTFGDCVVAKCPVPDEPDEPDLPSDPNLPPVTLLEAGTISITADEEEFTATGTPSGTNHKYVFQTSGSLGGGGVLSINATGGTISAFSSTIPLPLAPLLFAPSIDGMKGTIEIAVPRTADFAIRWDARASSEQIQSVATNPAEAPAGSPRLGCTFTSSAGAATFPVGALSLMPKGTRIRLFGLNRRLLETMQGSVHLVAAYEMVSTDKASYPVFVLQ